MKNYLSPFYVLIVMILGVNIYAQDTTNYNPVDQFTYKEHTSRVSQSDDTARGFFSPFLSSNNPIRPLPTLTNGLGSTVASIDVSLTGGLTYDVPISVPP